MIQNTKHTGHSRFTFVHPLCDEKIMKHDRTEDFTKLTKLASSVAISDGCASEYKINEFKPQSEFAQQMRKIGSGSSSMKNFE